MREWRKKTNTKHINIVIILIALQVVVLGWLLWRHPNLWRSMVLLWFLGFLGTLRPLYTRQREDLHRGASKGIVDTLDFAERTMPYFKEGLDADSAKKVVEIIREISNIPAVAITDRENVLAFIGEGCKYHPVGGPIRTAATLDALNDGQLHVIEDKVDFNCLLKNCDCPLASAIIVPLFNKDQVIGCLKFYDVKEGKVSDKNVRLAVGIGKMINMQLEKADYERQRQLTTEAKLDALQAQINPHFLFNALNTINMYIHKEPTYARQLVVRLSTLLRYMLGKYGRFIPISEELAYLEDYVMIENARYLDQLKVSFAVDPRAEGIEIPVFTIQPLVHNAIIHGVLPKQAPGQVMIRVERKDDFLYVSVEDDGVGIKEENMDMVFASGKGIGCGIGVSNVDERLRILYGPESGLRIKSQYGTGTVVSFKIPI